MNITDVNLFVSSNANVSTIGYGSITFDDFFRVQMTVKKSRDGSLYIGWPGRYGKDRDGGEKWYSDISFINFDNPEIAIAAKKDIEDYIINEFNKKLAISGKSSVKESKPVSKSGVSIKINKQKEESQSFNPQELMDEDDRIFQEELSKKG